MPPRPAEVAPALVLDGVIAGYGGRRVLDGLSLTLPAGAAYALLGSNGAGKSTAARVACGLLQPLSGRVAVGGVRPGEGASGRVGLAPQEAALFSSLSIRENLDVVAQMAGLRGAVRTDAVSRALRVTRSTERAGDRVGALSGGWRRRANLAGALVCRPRLLVLDEPTEGVDSETRTALTHAVRAALADGAGALIISHDAAFVAAAASRVGVLAGGRLIAEGEPGALLSRTFGEARRVSVKLRVDPLPTLRSRLHDLGLMPDEGGEAWWRLTEDGDALLAALSGPVQDAGGEISVRRPDLDDLLRHFGARAA